MLCPLWCVLRTKCSHLLVESFIELDFNSRKLNICSSMLLILKPKSISLVELSVHFGLGENLFPIRLKLSLLVSKHQLLVSEDKMGIFQPISQPSTLDLKKATWL